MSLTVGGQPASVVIGRLEQKGWRQRFFPGYIEAPVHLSAQQRRTLRAAIGFALGCQLALVGETEFDGQLRPAQGGGRDSEGCVPRRRPHVGVRAATKAEKVLD